MQNFNFHTHTFFSDGKSSPVEVIEEAIRQNMTAIGFSDHSPVPFENTFAIKNDKLDEYVKTIKDLSIKYKDKIDIYVSMEMDYIFGVICNFAETKKKLGLDYLIGSVHLVGHDIDNLWFIDGSRRETYDEGLNRNFVGDIRRGVKSFFMQNNQMIENEEFDIIGHFDKIKMHNQERYFKEDEKWYRDLVFETLNLIKERDLIVEINTRGIYKKRHNDFYPATWLMPYMKELSIPVIISSDSHHFSELSLEFGAAEEALRRAGYKAVMKFEDGQWKEMAM